jgi:hypothetical protein
VLNLPDPQKAEVLRDVYKKHSEELRAIEDSQNKLTGILLAIFGAGASFLAGTKQSIPCNAKIGLTVVVLAILGVGLVITYARSNARRSTRTLLIRCEKALGFEEVGYYIAGERLYGQAFQNYPAKGGWLNFAILLVAMSGVGFLFLLWSLN